MADTIDLGISGIGPATLLDRGGSAFVYLAEQEDFGRMVAVKVLFDALEDETTYRRFDRECRAIGAVSSHPNIVVVHGRGLTEQDRPYLVMEHRSGGSLADRLATRGRFTEPEAINIGIKIGGALQVAHDAGVLHRDVKPANILLSEYGEPALADFGIARMDGTHKTTEGVFSASVVHASREILDSGAPTSRSDVYALASTLFELVTGAPAFSDPDDRSVWAVVNRVLSEDPPDPASAGVSDELAAVLARAMSHDPDLRHPTAVAFVSELAAIIVPGRVGGGDPVAMNAPTLVVPSVSGEDTAESPSLAPHRSGGSDDAGTTTTEAAASERATAADDSTEAGNGESASSELGRGRRLVREEDGSNTGLSRSALLTAVAVITVGSVAIGLVALLNTGGGGDTDGTIQAVSNQDGSNQDDGSDRLGTSSPASPLSAVPRVAGDGTTDPGTERSDHTRTDGDRSADDGDVEPASTVPPNDDGNTDGGGGNAGGSGPGDDSGRSDDPAADAPLEPQLRFPRAEIGPLQVSERYVLAVTGVPSPAQYRIIVDGRPVTRRESTTPVYFPKPGRHQLQVEVATDNRVVLTEPVEIYVSDRPPRSGYRVNLSAIRSRPENWPDALLQFDQFVVDGHEGLQLSLSDRNEGTALPFWNYYVYYGADRDGALTYCEDRDLSNQDCYVAEVNAG